MPLPRLIPCLDVAGGRVVKGIKFEGLLDVGDPVELGAAYSDAADAATAPVEIDCTNCAGDPSASWKRCCYDAEVAPGTRPVALPRAREKNTHARASLPC